MGTKNQKVGNTTEIQKEQKVSRAELKQLIDIQQYCCALSGVSLSPDVAQIDHVVPIANGGTNSIKNLQVVHSVVNRMKGTLSTKEFILWCRLVAQNSDGSFHDEQG